MSAHDERVWITAYNLYLKAFELRPWRAEPLVAIADHYCQCQEYAISYIFARRAVLLPTVQDFAIDREVYEYKRYDVLSIVAWYVGEYEIGEQAIRTGLLYRPNDKHFLDNLKYYTGRKK